MIKKEVIHINECIVPDEDFDATTSVAMNTPTNTPTNTVKEEKVAVEEKVVLEEVPVEEKVAVEEEIVLKKFEDEFEK